MLSLRLKPITEEDDEEWISFHNDQSLYSVDSFASVVDQVQADGQELLTIFNNFSNLPMLRVADRVMSWFGDDAKFIAAHYQHVFNVEMEEEQANALSIEGDLRDVA